MPSIGFSGLLAPLECQKVGLVGKRVLVMVEHPATGNMDQISVLNQL